MKYFVINKKMDYERGWLEGTEYTGRALTLASEADYGVFFSRVFDCREQETCWHRFSAEEENPGTPSLALTFYAAETLEFLYEGRRLQIPQVLRNQEISAAAKMKILKGFEKKRVLSSGDVLLHEVKGRYFFFAAELYRRGGEAPAISRMTVFFPKEDWLKYLPAVYGRDRESADFTARFLGVFQSFYDDCERRIRTGSQLMEPFSLDYEGLKELAGWFHFEDLYIWPEEKLRLLLKKAPELMGETGTVHGMLSLLQIYTGEEPFLVECQNTEGRFRPETFERPYGQNPYEFVLLIREKYLSTARQYQAILCLIRQMKPAYMDVRLIPLRPRLTLGTYSYLGINSNIGGYSPMRLDGRSSLTFSAVGGNRTEGGTGT